jgi:predicted CoA-substrate-specific enzyme activase
VAGIGHEGAGALPYAGCDLGIITAKAVIIENGRILAAETLPYKSFPDQAAARAMEAALARASLCREDIASCLATGMGARAVVFAEGAVSEIISLHRAVRQLNPRARTVIDVGGHSFMAFNITEGGGIEESAVTDRCAAGTGMVLDAMASVLEMPLDELNAAAAGSKRPIYITNQCPIFAESEVISLINDGHDVLDLFAGVAASLAAKIAGLVGRVDLIPEVVMVGGVTRNSLVVSNLERKLGLGLARLDGVDPQAVAAYGAALLAEERHRG